MRQQRHSITITADKEKALKRSVAVKEALKKVPTKKPQIPAPTKEAVSVEIIATPKKQQKQVSTITLVNSQPLS